MAHSLKDLFPPKVKITKSKDKIEIDVQGNDVLLKDDHAVAFSLMNFEDSEDGNGYYIFTKNHDDIIKQVMDYLKEFGFEVFSDSEVSTTIEKLDSRHDYFQTSQERGMKIKNQKKPLAISPKNFNPEIKIKSYQLKPINHMIEVGHAANFSVPGSGKTLMTYAVFDTLRSKGIVDSLFVVGPIASFGPWEDEYKFCFNTENTEKIYRYLGSSRFGKLKNLGDYDIVLTSYGTATNDVDNLKRDLLSKRKVMMVIDESHHIKRFKEDATFANAMIELGKSAQRRYILSGTPVPRDFEDLWSQITFLWPYTLVLGSRDAYKGIMERFDAASEISSRINFLWTRVTNKQLEKDMPKVLKPKTHFVPMSEQQENIYKSIENDIWQIEHQDYFEEQDLSTFKKNRVLRLLQSVTNPGVMLYDDPDLMLDAFHTDDSSLDSLITNYKEIPPKIKKAAELALEISKKNQNVVVWTVFIKNVDYICQAIKKLDPTSNPIGISGEVPTDSDSDKDVVGREERLNNFKNNPGSILVATMGSIAEAVSLHKACQRAIYVERSFNAGQYMQSLSRIYRIGSDKKKPVQFIFLRSVFSDGITDTIDGRIDIILKERIRKLYRLLNDEFELHPLSLETANYKMRGGISSSETEETELTYKKITDMIDSHKAKNRI